jgi:hypothetical protein
MTSKVVHRLYWDFEKEERWLNEMAAKGEDLVRYRLGSYHFERGEPSEWVYRIELIPSRPGSEAGRDYLSSCAAPASRSSARTCAGPIFAGRRRWDSSSSSPTSSRASATAGA